MILQILLIIIAFIFQAGFPALLKFSVVFPDLVLVVVIFIAFAYPRKKIVFPVVIGGLLTDIFSGMPFGISSILFLTIVFLIEAGRKFLFADFNFQAILIAVFGATIFSDIFYFLTIRILHWLNIEVFSVEAKYLFFFVLPREILYNLIIVVIIYSIWILARYLTGSRASWR